MEDIAQSLGSVAPGAESNDPAPGRFVVIPTPVGNMGDITLRGIEELKKVEVLLCEDSREAGKLLSQLGIPRTQKLLSYRDQNHDRIFPQLLELLDAGKRVGLISDRGTPAISDPGYKLLRDLKNEGYSKIIEVLPGANSLLPALLLSGLPSDRFVFLGFLPRKSGKQLEILKQFLETSVTCITFESPFRIMKLLELLDKNYPEARIALCKDISKLHEQVFSGTSQELIIELGSRKIKGEWVVVVNAKI